MSPHHLGLKACLHHGPLPLRPVYFSYDDSNFQRHLTVASCATDEGISKISPFPIYGDIPRCLNERADKLIGAKDWKEVFQRADDFGISLNREKCQFGRSEIEFYGYKFSSQGLQKRRLKLRRNAQDQKFPRHDRILIHVYPSIRH
eukprot:gene13860-4805_t